MFLHSLPLWTLQYQNQKSDVIDFTTLGLATTLLPWLSLILVGLEICVLQLFESQNINLEMRIKLRSTRRLTDMMRVTAVSTLMTVTSLLIGLYAFEKQGCVLDYFEENSICKPCRDIIDPYCAVCEDRTACLECDRGFYALDQTCNDCKMRDYLCLHCDRSGCLEC